MLNIAGISSAPESIDTQHKRPTRDWSSSTDSGIPRNSNRFREFDPIPEFPDRNYVLPSPSCRLLCLTVNQFDRDLIPERNSGNYVEQELDGIPRNSHRFRNSGNWFQLRNYTEFLPIPTNSGIAGIGSDSGIANRNHTILLTHICDVVLISYSVWTRSNSVTEFRELRQEGIERNS